MSGAPHAAEPAAPDGEPARLYCPDCASAVLIGATRCGCGWRVPAAQGELGRAVAGFETREPHPAEWRDDMIANLAARLTEHRRKAGESKEQWRERMECERDRMAGIVRRKQRRGRDRADAVLRGPATTPATPATPAPGERSSAAQLDEMVADGMEEFGEMAGKLEAEGMPREIAEECALRAVLRRAVTRARETGTGQGQR